MNNYSHYTPQDQHLFHHNLTEMYAYRAMHTFFYPLVVTFLHTEI